MGRSSVVEEGERMGEEEEVVVVVEVEEDGGRVVDALVGVGI